MEHFASFEAHSISSEKCSIQIDRPTIAIKLDASKFLLVFFFTTSYFNILHIG